MNEATAASSWRLEGMKAIAIEAGRTALQALGRHRDLGAEQKGPRDFQTASDRLAETTIVAGLRKLDPEAGIWGEEGMGDREGEGRRYIIDPIDGTTNFAWGIPHFGIVISYEEAGEIIAGVVYDPSLDELFAAETGKGATLNGQPLTVVPNDDPVNALFGAGLPVPGQVVSVPEEAYHRALRRMMDTSSGVRRLGSSALSIAWVAAGRLDGFIEDGLSHIDMGASVLILREAGGVVTDFAGNQRLAEPSAICAATPGLHPWLAATLRD